MGMGRCSDSGGPGSEVGWDADRVAQAQGKENRLVGAWAAVAVVSETVTQRPCCPGCCCCGRGSHLEERGW